MGNTNFKPAPKPLDWSLSKLGKTSSSVVLGIILGTIPSAISILTITLITILRWPLNIFFSLKFVLYSPILKKDLRILLLIFFPILHLILPALFLIFSSCAAIVWSISATTFAVHKRFNPADFKWKWALDFFCESGQKYYEMHVEFVEKCESLIGKLPAEWENVEYGLDSWFDCRNISFNQIFDTLVLEFYGIVVMVSGSIFILTIKFPFIIVCTSYAYFGFLKDIMEDSRRLAFFPFILLFYCFGLGFAIIGYILSPFIAILSSLRCPWVGIRSGILEKGKTEAWNMLKELDNWTANMTFQKWEVLNYEIIPYKEQKFISTKTHQIRPQ